MNLETLRSFLAWCTVINWAFLLIWWLFIAGARDWVYRIHGRCFRLSEERFDEIHYRGLAYFKAGVILFNLTPYLVLRFTG
jgi:hypothetical protein